MSIRNKLWVGFIVAGSTFAFSEAASAQADSFKIASTSYSQPLTQVESIIGGKKVETVRYKLGNVDRLHDGLVYSSYGDQVINLKNSKTTLKKVADSPLRIKKYKNVYYALSMSKINEFSLTKYTSDFKKIGQTKRFVGHGRDMIVSGDKVYVLANNMKTKTNSVEVHTFDTTHFTSLHLEKIKPMVFAFHFRHAGNELKVYGNKTEAGEELSIALYDLKKQQGKIVLTSKQPVMWVNETKALSPTKDLVFNTYSMLEVDQKTKQVRVLYSSKQALIDYTYDSKTKTYHVLEGDFETTNFRVKTLNSHFKPVADYKFQSTGRLMPFQVL
ncbi:MAG TPA: hypothetical protein DIS82_01100 [Exiguobacterium sp.]|uniref:hypothetical protein n=1 Tax=Exiguobacterium sp. TaxID=44751 RepID=UPI000ED69206|nr:hypothetical protein [Exiguobacterium sp.]HCN56722.1 hypothetical protein [Exiguobacterium sp.]